eukprot:CAMPEP_0172778254 /NCGR_PEP_ID=MMETSP1074-20121228/201815_1 /TAXON_ID=2916 /ORGANISM="Ceratium fusus, Strain PA161109" /LENGTH=702 /DNA_ID=CAMNT_0013615185 /DNA_START=63 /DNA_END=2172 /DNA_ORIENTATION=-
MPAAPAKLSVCFSHVHMYCNALREPEEYRRLEDKLNDFSKMSTAGGAGTTDLKAGREAWLGLQAKHGDPVAKVSTPEDYSPIGQDIVEQLLVGLGWRVTGCHLGTSTRSLILTSADAGGVKFAITAHNTQTLNELASVAGAEDDPESKRPRQVEQEPFDHFDTRHLKRYAEYHKGRQGVAVLGFLVSAGGIDMIRARYAELHPKLIMPGSPSSYPGAKVLEVFAYYTGEKLETDADTGTMLRFIEVLEEESAASDVWVLPGIKRISAVFDGISQPAYCDHWVSNVFSRTGFLDTLNDTLGFTPKVDFNAGVVAAGEAQIESTVTGNDPRKLIGDKATALKDQSQVYLPINNALSDVGHVHVFLKELGQGIQHVASRVEDLSSLIQRANDYRKMTGAGLSFLQIPRSYYGYITAKKLSQDAGISEDAAERCLSHLKEAGIVDARSTVDLDVTRERVMAALPTCLPAVVADCVLRARYGNLHALLKNHASEETYLRIVRNNNSVLRARYGNLHALLKNHASEETYLRIVRNNILVDIQGEDLLLQIFTSKVLQQSDGQEAPFLEFIERVCSECKNPSTGCPQAIKPGCGGFGIRNFLTLFLSIEVSKAAASRSDAERRGDARMVEVEGKRVDAFTAQLDESNPILTTISDAMTAEGAARDSGDTTAAQHWANEKAKGNEALQEVSSKYKELMRKLREEVSASAA